MKYQRISPIRSCETTRDPGFTTRSMMLEASVSRLIVFHNSTRPLELEAAFFSSYSCTSRAGARECPKGKLHPAHCSLLSPSIPTLQTWFRSSPHQTAVPRPATLAAPLHQLLLSTIGYPPTASSYELQVKATRGLFSSVPAPPPLLDSTPSSILPHFLISALALLLLPLSLSL